jgi:homoserine kinase
MQRMLVEPHIAVSTNDLRRLVPFRRRLTDANSAHTANGFMTVGLLTELGGDPMAAYFAMQAGNIRIYEEGPICRILPSFPYSRS